MSFTATELAVIIGLVGGQIILIIQAFFTARKSHEAVVAVKENTALTAQTMQKVETVAITAAKIDGHVNSEKTASQGRESALVGENTLLRETLEKERTTAALLAQALATTKGKNTP